MNHRWRKPNRPDRNPATKRLSATPSQRYVPERHDHSILSHLPSKDGRRVLRTRCSDLTEDADPLILENVPDRHTETFATGGPERPR